MHIQFNFFAEHGEWNFMYTENKQNELYVNWEYDLAFRTKKTYKKSWLRQFFTKMIDSMYRQNKMVKEEMACCTVSGAVENPQSDPTSNFFGFSGCSKRQGSTLPPPPPQGLVSLTIL